MMQSVIRSISFLLFAATAVAVALSKYESCWKNCEKDKEKDNKMCSTECANQVDADQLLFSFFLSFIVGMLGIVVICYTCFPRVPERVPERAVQRQLAPLPPLRTAAIASIEIPDPEDICAICLDDFATRKVFEGHSQMAAQKVIVKLDAKCSHLYHFECIELHRKTSVSTIRDKCPQCQRYYDAACVQRVHIVHVQQQASSMPL